MLKICSSWTSFNPAVLIFGTVSESSGKGDTRIRFNYITLQVDFTAISRRHSN